MKVQVENYFNRLKSSIDQIEFADIQNCANILLRAYHSGNKVFICGNGGSASTASHFACDFTKSVSYGLEKRFKVIALTDSMSIMTAYTNDVSYDVVFVEQLKNFYEKGDVLIGISGSGNSQNVLNAIDYVNKNGGTTIGWTGFNGGKLRQLAQHSVNANVSDMQVSEDMHMVFVHLMMKIVRKELTGSEEYC